MLNLTQGITVKTGHVFLFQKNDSLSGFSSLLGIGDWVLAIGDWEEIEKYE